MLDVAKDLTADSHLDGFDICDSQFRSDISRPSNVNFVLWDVRQPPPESLHGKYDVVNLRLFLAVVENDDPTPMLEHAKLLLSKIPIYHVVATSLTSIQSREDTCNGANSIIMHCFDLVHQKAHALL